MINTVNEMKRLASIILSLTLGSAALCFAQTQSDLNRALFAGYEEILSKNPNDYLTLYERAAQYYYLSKYDDAFIDIIKALQYTPEKEKGMKMQALTLLADISLQQKDYARALGAVEQILAIQPDSYATHYKRGNILLHMERYEEAYRAFSGMQSLRSHSQEAYFGMAQAAMRMGREYEVEGLVKQAQDCNPNSSLTYCRIGDLYRDLKMPQRAATNYLVAINLDSNGDPRPVEALVAMAREDFAPVSESLDHAATVTQNPATIYYLKGHLAYSTGHFKAAQEALSKLMLTPQGLDAGLYRMFAESELALGNADKALRHINAGMALDSNTEMLKTRARIHMALDDWMNAAMDASQVVEVAPDDVEAQRIFALTLLENGNPKRAVEVLNVALMEDPTDIESLLIRGWIKENKLKDRTGAAADYQRASTIEGEEIPAIIKRCIAQSKAGRQLDADAAVERLMADTGAPETLYWGAVYYAQTSNAAKAKEMLRRAQQAGYENYHSIHIDRTPTLTLAPVRKSL